MFPFLPRRALAALLALLCLLAQADTLPLAPRASGLALDDAVVFRGADGTPFYIPQYQVASDTVGLTGGGQQQRYRMALAADGADWVLTVHLQAQPSRQLAIAPEQLSKARTLAGPVPRIALSYEVKNGKESFRRERQFQQVRQEANGLLATLRLASLSEQSELGAALLAGLPLQLSALREAEVGVELPDADPAAWRLLDDIELLQLQLQRDQTALLDLQRRLAPGDSTLAILQKHLGTQQAVLAGKRQEASRLQMRTRVEKLPLQLAQQLASDGFDIVQHPYLLQVPLERKTMATGLKQQTVNGRRYYQDYARPQRFYYLPDRFRLRDDSAAGASLAIRATANEDVYRIEYMAAPDTDPARLAKDGLQLARLANVGQSALELEVLQADSYAFRLNLPHENAWTSVERPHAVSSLSRPFTDTIQLSAEDLRLLYDALFAQFPLFNGSVTVRIGSWASETVPFIGQVRGEPEEVWKRVFDRSLPTAFKRRVQASASADCFRNIDAIVLTLDNGHTVELSRERPEAAFDVSQSVDDFVLRRQSEGSFRYRLTWRSGATLNDGGFRTEDSAQLMIHASDLVNQ